MLNSDGRRLFEEFARMLVYEHPEYKPLVSKARRDPSLENILRVAELVITREEARELIDTCLHGPYRYRDPY